MTPCICIFLQEQHFKNLHSFYDGDRTSRNLIFISRTLELIASNQTPSKSLKFRFERGGILTSLPKGRRGDTAMGRGREYNTLADDSCETTFVSTVFHGDRLR
ncbi:hypothetical protein CDAR_83021 [Caerostris darwini]|uniref:Uncharacterized protein n=1 Tax=Caerostris darwini TaxID=1538125 RepID=A0AAV4NXR7_9ARAC|nr:hypothetical protein CDAR_83021 [Caerostris darwini]